MGRPASVVLLLLPWLLTGCLHPVEIPTVELAGPRGGRTGQPESLGVVELADLRPREQKRGRSPWLIPLILWNQRTGRYVTGSRHFGDAVSADVSRAVADALSGWRFGRGRVLPPGPERDPAARCASEELAYLASGEIRHLYGAVRQRSWVFILPLPWFPAWLSGNQVGDAVGVVRLQLRIRDCRSGEQIASRRFVSEGVFPRLSPSAAALRAFDQVVREIEDLARVPADAERREDAPSIHDLAPPSGSGPEPTPAPRREPAPAPEEEQDPGEPELVPL